MACRIRADRNIMGIKIKNQELKLTQLADDTTLFLYDEKSLINALDLLERFSVCSGLKLNMSKTKIFCLGNTNHRPTLHSKYEILKTSSFKALGVHFCYNTDEMSRINLDERLEKFINILNIWKQRDLSLKGKITILKSLALPQLTYVSSVLPVSQHLQNQLIKKCKTFFGVENPPKLNSARS